MGEIGTGSQSFLDISITLNFLEHFFSIFLSFTHVQNISHSSARYKALRQVLEMSEIDTPLAEGRILAFQEQNLTQCATSQCVMVLPHGLGLA